MRRGPVLATAWVAALGLSAWPAIAAEPTPVIAGGGYHSLTIGQDGTLWVWGANGSGQLGDGTTIDRYVPLAAKLHADVVPVAVSGGEAHTLMLDSQGRVWAAGRNDHGQLGDGTTEPRATFVRVEGAADVTGVAAGWEHSLAVTRDGTVLSWGEGSEGQLGVEDAVAAKPQPVPGLRSVTAVAGGRAHSLALDGAGHVWAWGRYRGGEKGGDVPHARRLPARVEGLQYVVAIAAGGDHDLALTKDGAVWVWGANARGQLGDGTREDAAQPVRVPELPPVRAIACGAEHSLTLDDAGHVWTWGDNRLGQLGTGFGGSSTLPFQVGATADGHPLDGVVAIAAGGYHTLVVLSDLSVWAWGHNFYGQVGDWSTQERWLPVPLKRQRLQESARHR